VWDLQESQLGFSDRILQAFGLTRKEARPCSFAFSTKPPPGDWRAHTFSLPVSFYLVDAVGATYGEVRSLASGVKNENYVLVADLGSHALLVLRSPKKEDAQLLLVSVKTDEDYERVAGVIKKLNFTSDELSAHSSLNSAVELLRVGAERYYVNRGLFANNYLIQRLFKSLSERGRNPQHESESFLSKFGGELPTNPDKAREILAALGYALSTSSKTGYPQYILVAAASNLHTGCIIAPVESLDIKTGKLAAPSYQAVSALRDFDWVILTNGRLWRLYSNRVSSGSTNYFEIDIQGVVSDRDPKLLYFVSLFSASSFIPKQGTTDIQLTYEGGLKYAKEIEENLRSKIFDEKLFLDLVRAILDFSATRKYSRQDLEEAKATALKLLYRILFILYAEARALLPINNPLYRQVSMDSLRERLPAFENQPEQSSVWDYLQELFKTIGRGSPERSVPEYDGALFEQDQKLDGLSIKNKFLVRGLRDLTEIDGRGIDYQNLGVRHLGSLYEGLLEYSIRQATQDLLVYKGEILDASFASDLKAKPGRYIGKGELYLSIAGLARKGTGSYYTPEEIVSFLVRKGLESHLEARSKNFLDHMRILRQSSVRNPELERDVIDDLLGIRVLDPAMGSGHFLVTAVDEITAWIIRLLKENPDSPLVKLIEDDRQKIIQEQSKSGIILDTALLTDTVILKRTVMKRCIYGVDLNPLAVELAKLSLWLDSFTIGTPLTFLDHHIKCGDSLIGLRLENISSSAIGTTILDDWAGTVSKAGARLFEMVSMPADLTVDQVRQSRASYQDVRLKTEPLRILLDLSVASIIDPNLGKQLPRNLPMIEQAHAKAAESRPNWWNLVDKAVAIAKKYGAFHWELEFPDESSGTREGFDVVITNPPWDVVKPEDDDFFSEHYPQIRRVGNKTEKQKIVKSLLRDREIAEGYETYRQDIERRVSFYKQSARYALQGGGDTNLWKLFLERTIELLGSSGTLSLVIPSGIVTDEGGKHLREALFKGRISAMYEFENKNGIFDIHRSYKFVLLVWDKATPKESFPAAFYLYDPHALTGKVEQEKFVEIPMRLIYRSAPESFSIPEVRSQSQLAVFSNLYERHPLLSEDGKGWAVSLITELHRTNDSILLKRDGKGWPLVEGKHIHQFLPDFEKTEYTVDRTAGLKRTAKRKEFNSINDKIHKGVRLVFRDVASSTNVRSMIACLVPPESFCSNTAIIVLPFFGNMVPGDKEYSRIVSYVAGVFNSFVFDFLIRSRVTMHLNFFYVYQTPIPKQYSGGIASRIAELAARLNCTDNRFDTFAQSLDLKATNIKMKERIRLTAELNGLVAKHYGLSREDLAIILQSFAGFEEDKDLANLGGEIKWSDDLIRKFNGEVRKLVLQNFDLLA
jgi:hypothetical protein